MGRLYPKGYNNLKHWHLDLWKSQFQYLQKHQIFPGRLRRNLYFILRLNINYYRHFATR